MEASLLLTIPLQEFITHIEETVRKVLKEKTQDTDQLLTSEEVMSMLKISTTTLQVWRDNDKIPFTRMGNKIYYSKKEILKILSSR